MKKIVLILRLLLSFSIMYSQEIEYYSNFTSYKRLVEKDKWTDWTDWREYYIEIVFNTDSNTITIYDTDIEKVYKIHPIYEKSEDSNSTTIKYKVVESKNNCLYIRFRNQHDGVKQLYLDYKDLVYVYNLM